VSVEAFRAASLLLLFLPMTPLIFMGQEWGATTPFLYFTDHESELGEQVRQGRRREFAAFPEFADAAARERIPDPQARATFDASKLRWSEREQPEQQATLELYRAALALRRDDVVLARATREELLAEASGPVLMVHRWRGNERRVLVVNLGSEPLALEAVAPRLRLRQSRALLRSSVDRESLLAPYGAVLLAGEGNLAGLVEGAQ
jgi:maltooligosyltrehalose trehalohydrolase